MYGLAPCFRGAALQLQTLDCHEWIIAGPAETGKTFAALWLLDSLLRGTPKSQAVLVRKLRSTIDSTVLGTYKRIIAMRPDAPEPYGGSHPQWYDYPNGARLWVMGMDDPGKVLSGEYDWIYVNQAEELDAADWETLSTRVTGRGAVTDTPMLFGDCNPGPADHWILKRETLKLLKSYHKDNPTLYTDDGQLTRQGQRSMAILHALKGVRKQRLLHGLWVGAEGQFFEQWDEELHVIDPFSIPLDWPIWAALDYGVVHNTAFGVFTRYDGTIYLIGEHVQNKWLVGQHARAIDALLGRLGVRKARLTQIVAGHDVFQQRGDSQAMTIADQYADAGYVLEHADVDRINGAAALLERLGNPDADPPLPATLKIFRTCSRTIATIPAIVHDPRRPEDVLKVDADSDGSGGDDAYDMLRYGIRAAPQSGWTAQDLAKLAGRPV